MHKYTDEKGNRRFVSDSDLELAVTLKLELQKAGNGVCNWGTLCKKLRKQDIQAYRCENFRVLVRNYQKSLGKLPNKSSYANLISDFKKQQIISEVGELNIAKREVAMLKRDFNKLKKSVTDTAISKKDYYELANKNININVPEVSNVRNYKASRSAILITLSDLHIGAKTELLDSYYNHDRAFRLLQIYAEKIFDFIEFYKPEEVYIANLGDMIEGTYMRNNQSYDIDLNQGEQQALALEYVLGFVSYVHQYVKARNIKLFYTGITGNHDRSNGNKKDNIVGDSFITVLNSSVKAISNQLSNLEFIEPKNSNRSNITIGGTQIKLVHGDLDNLNNPSILANFSQNDKITYDMIIGGHKHSLMIKENSGLIVQAGSFVGNTVYSNTLNVSAKRSQIVTVINKETKNIQAIPVILE